MSGPFGSSQWMYSSAAGFYDHEISQSLRFEDGDNPRLTRTPSSAPTNAKKVTFSLWFKRGNLGGTKTLLCGNTDGNGLLVQTNSSNKIYIYDFGAGSGGWQITSDFVLRDVGSWYHMVLEIDTTQSTSSNRAKLYINGESINLGSWSVGNGASRYPNQNATIDFNSNGTAHVIGAIASGNSAWDGYLAELHVVDGQALDADDFGETKSGIWIPKAYSGSYGTNGFYLDFGDISPASDLGKDVSGNGNNFTPSAFFGSDQVIDSPTNNFCTLNAVNTGHNVTISQGNLKAHDRDSDTNASGAATYSVSSGKWYWEVLVDHVDTDFAHVGVSKLDTFDIQSYDSYIGQRSDGWGIFMSNGNKRNNASYTSYGSGFGDNDICMICLDMDNKKIWWGKNGTWFNSGNPASGTNAGFTNLSGEVSPAYTARDNIIFNFGQDVSFAGTLSVSGNADENGQGEFRYSPPSGFLALCSANLPAPAIDPAKDETPEDYFNTVLYTGDGVDGRAVNGVGFQPDFVWIKGRSNAYNHRVYDVLRGATKSILPDTNGAEQTHSNSLQSFTSDGFTLGTRTDQNNNNSTFVSWNWLAGGSGVSNTDGSITSTVSANTKAGFSIVSYSGTGSLATIGHGLDSAPELIIFKERNANDNWSVYTEPTGNTGKLRLNGNNSFISGSAMFNNTSPTSTVFTTNTDGELNGNMIAYCFHSVDGYSKIGKYDGNSSADGTFVYTGFRPAFVLAKKYTASDDWVIHDNKRLDNGPNSNPIDDYLRPNISNAEGDDGASVDFLSNGFKWRINSGLRNQSGQSYIYIAFAEQPFKYANAR